METIVEKFILQLEAQLAERRVAITLEPAARAWLAKKGYDPVFGARPLARVIQTEVRDPLTDEILFGKLETRRHRHDRRSPTDKLTFAFQAGSARVRVAPRSRDAMSDKEDESRSRSSIAAGGPSGRRGSGRRRGAQRRR